MSETEHDIVRVVRGIRAIARRRRAIGEIPDVLVESVEERFRQFAPPEPVRVSARIREALEVARNEARIDSHVRTDSRRSYLVPVKRGIRSAIGWYLSVIVTRVQEAIRASLHPVEVTGEVIESLEDRVEELEAQVAKLQRRLDSE